LQRTIVSVDLAYTSYDNVGVVVITSSNAVTVEPFKIPLSGIPDASKLAHWLADLCVQRSARLMFLDGPQGWRDPGAGGTHSRACESKLNAPAKTGLPGAVKPANYGPFVTFSIAVFDALEALGWRRMTAIDDVFVGNENIAVESFPLSAWRSLKIPQLPSKAKSKDHDMARCVAALRAIVPLSIAASLDHDELQALVGGIAGLAGLPGIGIDAHMVGLPPRVVDGTWREGFIVNPVTTAHQGLFIPTSEPPEDLFTLHVASWYAWQMLPGYGWGPYFSPIHIGEIRPMHSGKGLLGLSFFNARYATGVQGFSIKARVVKRTPEFIVLDLSPNGQQERAAIISEISHGWLEKFAPDVLMLQHEQERDTQKLLDSIYRIRAP